MSRRNRHRKRRQARKTKVEKEAKAVLKQEPEYNVLDLGFSYWRVLERNPAIQ